MSNPPDADSQDLTRKILENKKLKREIEQLAFEAEKRGFTSAAGEANFERTKREADLAELRRLERKDLRETDEAAMISPTRNCFRTTSSSLRRSAGFNLDSSN